MSIIYILLDRCLVAVCMWWYILRIFSKTVKIRITYTFFFVSSGLLLPEQSP